MLGGLYLVYMAVGIFRGAKTPLVQASDTRITNPSAGRAFLRGLLTQLSNPKTAVFYGSIFAALLPHDLPRSVALALPVLIFLLEAGWYSIVAVTLSSAAPRVAYLKWKVAIDRVAGSVIGLLGIKLLVSADAGR